LRPASAAAAPALWPASIDRDRAWPPAAGPRSPFFRRATARAGLLGEPARCPVGWASAASCGAPPSTPMAARPRLVMRNARGPASSSRRHTGIAAPAGTSSTNPSRSSFPITLPAAPPLRLGMRTNGAVLPPRGSRQQYELGISECHGILRSVGDGVRAVTTEVPQRALKPAGQDPGSTKGALQEHQQSRSVRSGNTVLCARKYGFVGCFRRCEPFMVATPSSLSKGALQNDICRFESSMPSQPVRSPLCDFRVCENRRHSRALD
jgi:hypothetical protein